jgi:hypothetical protein
MLFSRILTLCSASPAAAAAVVAGAAAAWGYQSWQAAVDGWYNEVELYNFARPGFSGATGEPRPWHRFYIMHMSHFCQLDAQQLPLQSSCPWCHVMLPVG